MRHPTPTRLLLLAATIYVGLIAAGNSSPRSSAAVVLPVVAADYAPHGVTNVTGTATNEQPATTAGETLLNDGRRGALVESVPGDGASGRQKVEEEVIHESTGHATGSTVKRRSRALDLLSKLRKNPHTLAAASVLIGLGNLALLVLLLQSSGGGRSGIRGAAGKVHFQWHTTGLFILGHILLPVLIGLAYVWIYQYINDNTYVVEKEA